MRPDPANDPRPSHSDYGLQSPVLGESSPFLEAITELLPVCLFAKDLEGRYIYVNDAFVQTTNQPDKASILGKKASDIFSLEHATMAESEDSRILQTGQSIVNRENLNKDWYHGPSYVIVSKICVRDKNGQIIGIAGITLDITQRKEDEIRLAELNEVLEMKNQQLEEELTLAREVQKAFVRVQEQHPKKRLDIGHCYQPSKKLSGDLIIFEPIDEERWAVLVCDVMGHGMRSALITGIIRGFYDEQKHLHENPHTFVRLLNEHYCAVLEDLITTIFTTLTYGLLNTQTGQLKLTCAGHHDPIWFRPPSGSFVSENERLVHSDPAIGLLKDIEYQTSTLSIEPGDSLMFYTDGLTECRAADETEFGEQSIRQIIRDNRDASCSAIVENVISEAHAFAADIEDDLSMLMFRRL